MTDETEMRTAFDALAEQLDASHPVRDPAEIAQLAQRRLRYRRAMLRFGIPVIAVSIALALLLTVSVILPEARRLLAPPPAVVVKTFPVKCLSPDQVAGLLRPYLPRPQNPRWQAEMFDVIPGPAGVSAVTMRAPQELIDRTPALIQQLEQQFATSCTR